MLPCQLPVGVTTETLKLTGRETFDLTGLGKDAKPRQPVTLVIHRPDGGEEKVTLTLRLDTPAEINYVRHGGIMPYMLEELVA